MFTDKQYALLEYMSEMSEEWWSAGWNYDLEFLLWEDLQKVKQGIDPSLKEKTGHAPLYRSSDAYVRGLEKLEELSNAAGGWGYFPDDKPGEDFMPMDQWLSYYEEKWDTSKHRRKA